MKIINLHNRFISKSECRIYGGQYQFLVEADRPITRYMAGQIQTRLGYSATSHGVLDVNTMCLKGRTWLSTWYCFAVETSRYDRVASSRVARYTHGNNGNKYAAKELAT